MDAHVNNVRVTQQTRFTPRGDPYQVTQYSYYCGQNGPFTLEYPLGADTADKVTMDMENQCQKLYTIGALHRPGA